MSDEIGVLNDNIQLYRLYGGGHQTNTGCLVVMRKLYVSGDVTMCYRSYRPRTFFLGTNVH
jgi:hypothetical protein